MRIFYRCESVGSASGQHFAHGSRWNSSGEGSTSRLDSWTWAAWIHKSRMPRCGTKTYCDGELPARRLIYLKTGPSRRAAGGDRRVCRSRNGSCNLSAVKTTKMQSYKLQLPRGRLQLHRSRIGDLNPEPYNPSRPLPFTRWQLDLDGYPMLQDWQHLISALHGPGKTVFMFTRISARQLWALGYCLS
jgi:hypothetical protein